MALAFRTRDRDRVYFPTMQVHDRTVHPTAHFDHELYCQLPTPLDRSWERSTSAPIVIRGDGQDLASLSKGLLVEDVVYRKTMHGTFDNTDVYAP